MSSYDLVAQMAELGVKYMEQPTLVKALRQRRDVIAVVDVRDEDRLGGHIPGSLHCPEGRFDVRSAAALADQLAGMRAVVFHCMESVMRGPRAACRFSQAIYGTDPALAPRVYVLRGGFDKWVRAFGRCPDLVEAVDDDVWFVEGFADAPPAALHPEYAAYLRRGQSAGDLAGGGGTSGSPPLDAAL